MIQIFATETVDNVEYAQVGRVDGCKKCVAYNNELCRSLSTTHTCYPQGVSANWLPMADALKARITGETA